MPLRLTDDDHARVAALDAELRTAAEAIGAALAPQLKRLTPALAPQAGGAEPEAVLTALDLDHEGAPDPLSLAACVAAHRAYVAARGRPEGVSTGALAIARLLVWGQRAALLGPAPKIAWIGPAPRQPEAGAGQAALRARCVVTVAGTTRRAEAAALVAGGA